MEVMTHSAGQYTKPGFFLSVFISFQSLYLTSRESLVLITYDARRHFLIFMRKGKDTHHYSFREHREVR